MTLGDAGSGLFAASSGIFNAANGIQHNLMNLGTTDFGRMTIQSGAHVQTPGATWKQEGDVYDAFANGNTAAYKDGSMTLGDAGSGLFAASSGIFNAANGIQHNLMNLGTTDFGRMTIQSGAHVQTPGATWKQEGDVYDAFANGNTAAYIDGSMTLGNA